MKEIVIKISDREYELLQRVAKTERGLENLSEFGELILKGTPLPKGHGRLVDADSMKTMKNIQSANFNAVELIRYWIDNQPTIIEADKENECGYGCYCPLMQRMVSASTIIEADIAESEE